MVIILFILNIFLVFVNVNSDCIVVMEQPFLKINYEYTGIDILERNSDVYIKIIEKASKLCDLSVIVFPEATFDNILNDDLIVLYAFDIVDGDNPCTINIRNYPENFQKISCAALKYKIIIILNSLEYNENNFCSSDIVFNQNGAIAFTCKREHRIAVSSLSTLPIPFDLPIRFAMPISHEDQGGDIHITKITPTSMVTGFSFSHTKIITSDPDRIYTVCSDWISQLPFLTSMQVYQMWAQEFNITLFISGVSNPSTGHGGVGIFHGGPVLMDYNVNGKSNLYAYEFTKSREPGHLKTPMDKKDIDTLAEEMDNFFLEIDPDLERYKSVKIDPTNTVYSTRLCYGSKRDEFCCEFKLTISYDKVTDNYDEYTYHMIAYKGSKDYYDIFKPGGIEVCAVIACLDETISSCGQRFENYKKVDWPITFETLEIKARFDVRDFEQLFYDSQFPNSLLSSIRPIHPTLTSWTTEIIEEKKKKFIQRTFAITKPMDRILTFGIFGRNFTLSNSSLYNNSQSLLPNYYFILLSIYCFYF